MIKDLKCNKCLIAINKKTGGGHCLCNNCYNQIHREYYYNKIKKEINKGLHVFDYINKNREVKVYSKSNTKRCKECQEDKNLNEYFLMKKNKNTGIQYLQSNCKLCYNKKKSILKNILINNNIITKDNNIINDLDKNDKDKNIISNYNYELLSY